MPGTRTSGTYIAAAIPATAPEVLEALEAAQDIPAKVPRILLSITIKASCTAQMRTRKISPRIFTGAMSSRRMTKRRERKEKRGRLRMLSSRKKNIKKNGNKMQRAKKPELIHNLPNHDPLKLKSKKAKIQKKKIKSP